MAKTVLGIMVTDGHAALLRQPEKGRSSGELRRAVVELPEDRSPESLADILGQAVQDNDLASDHYVLGLDARTALLRELFFPFTSPEKISRSMSFELEQQLPIPLNQLVTDFLLGPRKDSGAVAISASLGKDYLGRLLKALGHQNIDPVVVDLDVFALLRMCEEMQEAQAQQRELLVDLGVERTLFVSLRRSELENVQIIHEPGGGLLGEVSVEFQITKDEALRRLVFADLSRESREDEDVRLKQAVQRYLFKVQRELARCAEENGAVAQQVLLTGRWAEIGGICALLEEQTDCPVRLLVEQVRSQVVGEDISEQHAFIGAHGLLLSWNKRRRSGLNFRKDEFQVGAEEAAWKTWTRWGAAAASVLLVSWLVYMGAQIRNQMAVTKYYDQQIDRVLEESLAGLNKTYSESQRLSILQQRIQDLRRRVRFQLEQEQMPALDVLKMIHENVAGNLNVNVDQITLDERRVGLSGTVADYKTGEAMRDSLAGVPAFANVKIRGAKNDEKTKRVQFELELVRKAQGGGA